MQCELEECKKEAKYPSAYCSPAHKRRQKKIRHLDRSQATRTERIEAIRASKGHKVDTSEMRECNLNHCTNMIQYPFVYCSTSHRNQARKLRIIAKERQEQLDGQHELELRRGH